MSGEANNFMTGLMQGYGFVDDRARADRKEAREQVLANRADAEYQQKQDLNKVQAVRYALAATPPGEDPLARLTPDQQNVLRPILDNDPRIQEFKKNPQFREQERVGLQLIREGMAARQTPEPPAAPDLSNGPPAAANPEQYGPPSENASMSAPVQSGPDINKVIQGANILYGPQLNKGVDKYGTDISATYKEYGAQGVTAPDGTPVGTKFISRVVPGPDGKSVAFALKVTTVQRDANGRPVLDGDGKPIVEQYTAPLTDGRNSGDSDMVKFTPISSLAEDVHLREHLLSYADSRAVELGDDEPVKQQRTQENTKVQKLADQQLAVLKQGLELEKEKFREGLITERELKKEQKQFEHKMEEIKVQKAADMDKEKQKEKGAIELERVKGEEHRKTELAKLKKEAKNTLPAEARLIEFYIDRGGRSFDEAVDLVHNSKTDPVKLKVGLVKEAMSEQSKLGIKEGDPSYKTEAEMIKSASDLVDKMVEESRGKASKRLDLNSGAPAATQALAGPRVDTPTSDAFNSSFFQSPGAATVPTPSPAPAKGGTYNAETYLKKKLKR